MHNLRLFQFLNETSPIMANPHRKVAHALMYIQGPAVGEWKRTKENWIMGNPIPTPPRLTVWEEFKQDFVQDWTNTNEHYKAAFELDQLRMTGSDIDTYIVRFGELA